jgi:hypothetical protein
MPSTFASDRERMWTAIIGAVLLGGVLFAGAVFGGKPTQPARPTVRPRAVAYLAEWGKHSRRPGVAWGIVALPDTGWRTGDTLILLTTNARREARP